MMAIASVSLPKYQIETIPEALRQHPYWAPANLDKVPLKVRTRGKARTNDPETFAPFEEVVKYAQAQGLPLIGVLLGDGLMAIDIDHCRDPQTGELSCLAQEALDRLPTYGEISPSGTGVHFFLRVRADDLHQLEERYLKKDTQRGVECYWEARFMSVTGNRLNSQEVATLSLADFCWLLKPKEAPYPPAEGAAPLDVDERICHALEEDAQFRQLWEGNGAGRYRSPSEADLALCFRLARLFSYDREAVERAFLRSPAGQRAKVQARPDYVQRTVEKACQSAQAQQPLVSENDSIPSRTILSAKELMSLDLPELKMLVPDILAEGVTLLVGKAKVGKSQLALNLAVAIATGGLALGKIPVPYPQPVLYLAFEDTGPLIQRRLGHLLQGVPPPENLFLRCPLLHEPVWPPLRQDGIEALEKVIREHHLGLVIVDVLKYLRLPQKPSSNLYEEDYKAIMPFKELYHRTGASFLLIHHKNKGFHMDPLDEVSGSAGLPGGVDNLLILERNRGQGNGKLFITGRGIPEKELALHFSPQGGWLLVEEVEEAEEVQLSPARRMILEVLRKSEAPLSIQEIAKIRGKKYHAVYKIIKKLVKTGEVKQFPTHTGIPYSVVKVVKRLKGVKKIDPLLTQYLTYSAIKKSCVEAKKRVLTVLTV